MILLDTCTLLWVVGEQGQLSTPAKKIIEKNVGNIYVSAISAFEIGTKYNKGMLSLPLPPLDWFEQALSWHGITEIAINSRIAAQSTTLPKIHTDPADRIIIATAIENHLSLLTPDQHITTYSLQTSLKIVW